MVKDKGQEQSVGYILPCMGCFKEDYNCSQHSICMTWGIKCFEVGLPGPRKMAML